MARQRQRKRPMSEINVVPYIDVMLVMLVIFMITAPLLNQGVDVELPQADAEPMDSDQKDPLVLTIDADGRYFLNIGDDPEQPIDEGTLVERASAVLRRRPDATVMVRGDADVDYGRVVAAMALLQQAGARRVGLVTEPVSGGGG
ncbi:cell division and transport-associated protein TolR [Thiogranum longum]|uniref:Tol-Pal system protein TolR n=1 Tax=Thiogranum longum TaxID=1537524 RepID=A0A4R1HB49_9GAMM|nr:protein TolR [Thiogranum longum]TCK17380.1 cell division and transport-associated protein TolR [Thiogranum longum]